MTTKISLGACPLVVQEATRSATRKFSSIFNVVAKKAQAKACMQCMSSLFCGDDVSP